MDKEAFRKLLVQWASEDVYINQLTWEEGDALAEYLAKWYAAQQKRAIDPPLADGTRTDSKNMFVSPESRTDGTAGN